MSNALIDNNGSTGRERHWSYSGLGDGGARDEEWATSGVAGMSMAKGMSCQSGEQAFVFTVCRHARYGARSGNGKAGSPLGIRSAAGDVGQEAGGNLVPRRLRSRGKQVKPVLV